GSQQGVGDMGSFETKSPAAAAPTQTRPASAAPTSAAPTTATRDRPSRAPASAGRRAPPAFAPPGGDGDSGAATSTMALAGYRDMVDAATPARVARTAARVPVAPAAREVQADAIAATVLRGGASEVRAERPAPAPSSLAGCPVADDRRGDVAAVLRGG